jgi:D-3-phosphoglycerate dehydrogenase
MKKIAITTTSFGRYENRHLELLKENRLEVILNPHGRKLKKDEVVELCSEAAGIIAGTEILDTDVMENLPNLRVISRCGTGLDNVDLNAAKRLGIRVFNTPDAPILAVAELTVGLILNLLRKVNQMDTTIKSGKWEKLMGNLLYGKKVGIIGFGRIGQKVAELLSTFGVDLAYYDIETKSCKVNCSEKKFDEVLNWADIITLHLSPPKGSSPVIGSKEIKMMKKGSWLINVSRGGMIDENALYNFLKEGYLSGAALDVFEHEPYTGTLKELNNVILTPHIGSYAKEARIEMERQSVENLLRGLETN